MPSASIRLVLADDHPIVLDGLKQLFLLEPGFQVLDCVTDGEKALKAVHRLEPDILVLDLGMPGKDGFAVLQELNEQTLPTQVVVLTALGHNRVTEAIRLGARGIVLKDMAPALLIQCVREVHAGRKWLEKRAAAHAIDAILTHDAAMEEIARALTPRELEVARMVKQGLRNKAIARQLDITVGTTKLHLHNIYEKLKLDGRVALVRFLASKGLD